MKKLAILLVSLLTISIAQAQEQGDIRFQLGADYKLQINDIGANAGFEFLFADNFAIAPNFTYWSPNFGRSMNLNVDLRYYITEGPSQLYVLGGYSNYWDNTQPGLPGTTLVRSGANFGMGSYFVITETLGVNTEFKFQSQNTRQPVLRIGIVYNLPR